MLEVTKMMQWIKERSNQRKLTTPDEVRGIARYAMVDKLINEIEEKIKELVQCAKRNNQAIRNPMTVIVSGEYSNDVRQRVAEKYVEAGWEQVIHSTSSKNGERPGLTAMNFYWELT